MKLTITIQMDNAAFQDSGEPGLEAARILRQVAEDLAGYYAGSEEMYGATLMDANGNTVGQAVVSE